jgi:hypothetical protein
LDPSEIGRARRLVGEIAGVSLDDVSPEEMQRILRDAGLPVDDPTQVAELLRHWEEEFQPAVFAAAVDPETDAFLVVDPVFQAAMERLGPNAIDAAALANEPAGIRAIVATRLVDGLIDNGGWTALFAEGQQGLVPLAIAGYRLLGLEDHATVAERAIARGFTPPGPEDDEADDPEELAFWEDLDAAWFELPSAEAGRAAHLGANPDIR